MLCSFINSKVKMKRKSTTEYSPKNDAKEQLRQRQIQLNVLKIILITMIFTTITVLGSLLFDAFWH